MKGLEKTKNGATYNSLAREYKRTKSEVAFAKLYHKMRPSLRNFIKNIVKDYDVTEDLLARTFQKIYEKIDTYDAKSIRFTITP